MRQLFLVILFVLGSSITPGLAKAESSTTDDHLIAYKPGKRAFTHVRLIDGTGAKPKLDQTIIVENDRILKIGDSSQLTIPKGFEVFNLENKTIIPGIVGVHNHLHLPGHGYNGENIAKLYLAAGVTTIQTVGSAFPAQEVSLAKDIQQGNKIGPEIVASAPYFTGPGGNPHMQQATNPVKIAEILDYWKKQGVKWIKVYRNIEPQQLKDIIDQARQLDMLVTGHLCSVTFAEAVDMGIDGIQHGLNSASDFRTHKEYGKCNGGREYIDQIDIASDKVKSLHQMMIDNKVFLTSTLSIFESSISHRSQADDRSLNLMSETMKQRYLKGDRTKLEPNIKREQRLKRIMAFDYQFYQMGGLLGSGVDAGRFLLPGYGDQRNYELLIEAGFMPEQAIQVMTSNGARILQRDDIGLVAEGKRADFIILEGDLVKHPDMIKKVNTVYKQGVGYDPQKIEKALRNKIGRE